jgi:hypothetical protein
MLKKSKQLIRYQQSVLQTWEKLLHWTQRSRRSRARSDSVLGIWHNYWAASYVISIQPGALSFESLTDSSYWSLLGCSEIVDYRKVQCFCLLFPHRLSFTSVSTFDRRPSAAWPSPKCHTRKASAYSLYSPHSLDGSTIAHPSHTTNNMLLWLGRTSADSARLTCTDLWLERRKVPAGSTQNSMRWWLCSFGRWSPSLN